MKVEIGTRIKYWRQQRGLTQDDLARITGVKYSTLAKIESNITSNPRIESLQKIAAGLEITIDELLKEE